MNDKSKSWIIASFGFLSFLLKYSFPVDGGGVSLIFVLTIPFLLVVSIALAFLYFWRAKKIVIKWRKNLLFLSSVLLVIGLTFVLFPCSDADAPCPCKVVYKSSKVISNYSQLNYDDLLVEKTKANYPLIIASQKKFKERIPSKIYYVTYNSSTNYTAVKDFAIYLVKDSIKSNNQNLKMVYLSNNLIQFSEIYKGDTLKFIGTTIGFIKMDKEYNQYNDNGYGYINWTKETPNYEIQIRKEVENDIYNNYLFYRILYGLL